MHCFPKEISFHPLTALFGHPVQKYFLKFFALIKKSFLNTYLKYYLDVIKNNFRFLGPPCRGPPYKQKEDR